MEMQLIDADKFHLKLLDMEFPIQDQDPILDTMDDCIVDAVPVVRCKDCLYLQRDNMTCELHYETVSPDYFCSSGKDWRNEKIEIKLKECCLKCEHFDPSGIQGLSPYSISRCGEPDRVIACGHMAVCKMYLGHEEKT